MSADKARATFEGWLKDKHQRDVGMSDMHPSYSGPPLSKSETGDGYAAPWVDALWRTFSAGFHAAENAT